MKFYGKLKQLAPEQIGQIVAEIIKKCPSAFKENDDENAQLHVDNLDLVTFQEVNKLADSLIEDVHDKLMKKVKY